MSGGTVTGYPCPRCGQTSTFPIDEREGYCGRCQPAAGAPLYYAKDGEPITLFQYAKLFRDPAYKRVGQDQVGELWVSTIWLGVDHSFGFGSRSPLIFETMVFATAADGSRVVWGEERYQFRYSTEDEALAGHEAVCAALRVAREDASRG